MFLNSNKLILLSALIFRLNATSGENPKKLCHPLKITPSQKMEPYKNFKSKDSKVWAQAKEYNMVPVNIITTFATPDGAKMLQTFPDPVVKQWKNIQATTSSGENGVIAYPLFAGEALNLVENNQDDKGAEQGGNAEKGPEQQKDQKKKPEPAASGLKSGKQKSNKESLIFNEPPSLKDQPNLRDTMDHDEPSESLLVPREE